MRLTHLCLLLACASLSIGVAGVSLWQGYVGTAEQVAAAIVLAVLTWTMRAVWRTTGPVHEGGDAVGLRMMPEAERRQVTEWREV